MRSYFYHFLFLLFLLAAQVAAFKVFSHASVWFPQLLLLWMIVFALQRSLIEVAWLGLLGGFLSELFSGFFFGSQIAALLIVGIVSYYLTRKLTAQEASLPLTLLLVTGATLLFPFLVYVFNALAGTFGLGSTVRLREFYSATIIWIVLSNLISFYPLRALFKLLPSQEGQDKIV